MADSRSRPVLIARALLVFAAALALGACTMQAPVGSFANVPLDAPAKCGGFCTKMGMGLGAVVVMANNVGCVCTPNGLKGGSAEESGAAAGGMTALLIQQQVQQQQAAQQAQHH
jgi:hypothetical protein